MKRLGGELKTAICDYQLANAQAVETYSADISKRLNTLSTLRSDINNLTKSSDVAIVSKYTSTVDSSTELLKTTPGPVILHRKVLSTGTPLIHQSRFLYLCFNKHSYLCIVVIKHSYTALFILAKIFQSQRFFQFAMKYYIWIRIDCI